MHKVCDNHWRQITTQDYLEHLNSFNLSIEEEEAIYFRQVRWRWNVTWRDEHHDFCFSPCLTCKTYCYINRHGEHEPLLG